MSLALTFEDAMGALAVVVTLVAYVTVTKRDVQDERHAVEHHDRHAHPVAILAPESE